MIELGQRVSVLAHDGRKTYVGTVWGRTRSDPITYDVMRASDRSMQGHLSESRLRPLKRPPLPGSPADPDRPIFKTTGKWNRPGEGGHGVVVVTVGGGGGGSDEAARLADAKGRILVAGGKPDD